MKPRHRKRMPRTSVRRSATRAPATLAVASLAAMVAAGLADPASARSHRIAPFEVQSRPAGPPLLAVVALSRQRITVYDADGWILRAPVSSGQPGYETPAGIYSVLQKEAEHYSNLYDDASMPFMQRLTWSGIALHAGVLPGHPASHGCVRMPHDFAEHLFELTKVGMRVVVAPKETSPGLVADPALFKPRPALDDVAPRPFTSRPPDAGGEVRVAAPATTAPGSEIQPPGQVLTVRAIAAAKAAEAQAAVRQAQAARTIVNKMMSGVARAQMAVHMTETALSRADIQLAAADNAVATARSPEAAALAQETRVVAFARVLDIQLRVDAATAELQSQPDATSARAEAEVAEAQKNAAVEAAKQAAHRALPISVFISRKTQHLYVRQSFEPLFDSPVSIRDADQVIGTHVFTALAYTDGNANLQWNVLSMPGESSESASAAVPRQHNAERSEAQTDDIQDTGAARTALHRIAIPEPALQRISQLISPGSSLIVSDEGMSPETGHATDFVVLMSGEPQGGIKIRRHNPEVASRSEHRASHPDRSNESYSRSYGSRPSYGGNYFGGNNYYGGNYYGRTYYGGSFFGGYSHF